MKYKNYIVDAEEIYNEDYQTTEYLGVVLDENNKIVARCKHKKRGRNNALEDAKELVDCRSLSNIVGFDSSQKRKWQPPRNKIFWKTFLYIIIAIIIWLLIFLVVGDIAIFVPIIFILILPFILVLTQKKQTINYGAFIFDDGLYLVALNNKNISTANILSRAELGGIGASYAVQGLKDNANYYDYARGIDDFTKLEDKPLIWKFEKINNIEKLNNNSYKIDAEYTTYNNKRKRIKFKLKNNYEDFQGLINAFYYIKDGNKIQ